MIIPIRCFSCGKPIAQLWQDFKKRTEAGENAGKVLDSLGLNRYCCRAVFLGHAQVNGQDLADLVSRFKKF